MWTVKDFEPVEGCEGTHLSGSDVNLGHARIRSSSSEERLPIQSGNVVKPDQSWIVSLLRILKERNSSRNDVNSGQGPISRSVNEVRLPIQSGNVVKPDQSRIVTLEDSKRTQQFFWQWCQLRARTNWSVSEVRPPIQFGDDAKPQE